MNKRTVLFLSLSVLLVVVGLPLTLKQNWKQFAGTNKPRQALLTGTLHNVKVFDEDAGRLLQHIISDSVCIMFRFTPNTCQCLEPDFTDAVNLLMKKMSESKVFVLIAAQNQKEVSFFRERTKLSCPIYGREVLTNKDLDFSQSQQLDLSYTFKLNEYWRMGMAVYFQRLSQLPVKNDSTSIYSIMNTVPTITLNAVTASLAKARDVTRVTFGHYFRRNYYALLALTLYQSEYHWLEPIMVQYCLQWQLHCQPIIGLRVEHQAIYGDAVRFEGNPCRRTKVYSHA